MRRRTSGGVQGLSGDGLSSKDKDPDPRDPQSTRKLK